MNNKTYNPTEIEQHWYKIWEQNGYFTPQGAGSPYCIVIPPPNVTGSLHMGHGFQLSIMDALTRYHRMRGNNTLWQVGTDHAGIATQMVVENQLRAEGSDRHQLGREAFLKRIWEWKEYSGNTITKQQRRLGISVDWERERFTLDPGLSEAVQQVFISLHQEGLIYRGTRLVNWDPELKTAVSDLEVLNEDCTGSLWYIKYPVVDSDEYLVVATTRPETMLGDAAVAVHPDDVRYQHLIGKNLILPLTNRQIPVIADTYVTMEFGTGCVKITPAHDFNDYAVGQRHDLPLTNIFTPTAHINENAPAAYQNLDRFAARAQIIKDLEAAELLIKVEPHQLKLPKGERSGVILEPYLTNQWFVKAKPLAEPAIAAVKNGAIKFIPENWDKTYFQWLENIEDWCISRQLWWGHRIPAWYDAAGNIYVGKNADEIRAQHNLGAIELTQDADVLDTWFSAALWPFSSLGWPENTPYLKTFYPTNVLVTGFDLIFFWVARMVMLGLKFTGEVPFREVYFTGLIRDSKGQKMSKSKGNVLDPIDLIDGIDLDTLIAKRTSNLMQTNLVKSIEKNTRQEFPEGIAAFGTDALRFTFCAIASTSRDINFDISRLEGYRNFCTKLWNAARFITMQTEAFTLDTNVTRPLQDSNSHECSKFQEQGEPIGVTEQWITHKLHHTINTINKEFSNYRFDLLTQALYDFTWHEFCDWYLELTKPILTGSADLALKASVCKTLLEVFTTILRLLHPFMPFITEELWQQMAPKLGISPGTIMLQPYPEALDEVILATTTAANEVEYLKKLVIAIRNVRGEMNLSPNKLIPLWLCKGTDNDNQLISKHAPYLLALAKLESIQWITAENLPATATAIVDNLELHIPLANLIDLSAEITRLNKEIAKLTQEIAGISQRLDNQNYLAKAPQEVVVKEQQKLAEKCGILEKLQQRLHAVADSKHG